jgi:hypothetical protein
MSLSGADVEASSAVELLSDRAAYADSPRSVELVETHISWIFLTDHFAYKVKKPVRFDFLDFSTPELRRDACREEVRLNRRLASDVYLGTLPITRNDRGFLELAGRGEAVDWVVQMRRLPEAKSLARKLRDGNVTSADELAVARHLADFYARLPSRPIEADEYRGAIANHVRANVEACLNRATFDTQRMRRILGSHLRYLSIAASDFAARVAAGHVVDGHGDLRPEHIYLESPPAVIDCIEFSAELRRVDVLDDLSFLAMECDRIGHGPVGERIVAACQAARGDVTPPTILAFYMSYRALVRAKVMWLRADQEVDRRRRAVLRQAHQYVDWAECYSNRLGRPALVFVGGLMGTGKSTLAGRLADQIGAEMAATDPIRRALFGASLSAAGYDQQIYQPRHRSRVYDELFSRAAAALDAGLSIVLDGTFLTGALRRRAVSLAQLHGGMPLYVHCHCPRETALARIAARTATGDSASEGRVELFDRQAAEQSPMEDDLASVAVDTTAPPSQQLQQVFCGLRRQTLPHSS